MKRWPIILLISRALIVVVSPGIVGHFAEKNLDENLRWLQAENDDIIITAETFDRGWFTSEGQHRITLKSGSLLAFPGVGDGSPQAVDEVLSNHCFAIRPTCFRAQPERIR